MASIVSKLTRAAVATRASPAAVGGIAGGGRPLSPCLPRLYQTSCDIGISPAGGPKSGEEEKATPKPEVHCFTTTSNDPQLAVDDNALKSKKAMWAFYEYWCKYHGISRDRSEMKRRFKTFSANARFVHRAQNSSTGVQHAMTEYADMTREELWPGLGSVHRNDLSPSHVLLCDP